MAHIPVAQQFHTLTSSVVTTDLGSTLANSGREVYTMQDIIDTVSYSGGAIDGSGTANRVAYFTDSNTIAALNSLLDVANGSIKIGSFAAATGAGNTVYGVRAMDASSTGANNVAIGMEAGNAITSGAQNVLIGKSAGDLVNGDSNVVIGFEALTSGNENACVAVGAYALKSQNSGGGYSWNVAVGFNAGRDMTTGVSNTLLGSKAGDALQSGNYNVAIGHTALCDGTGYGKNVAIGHKALTILDVAGDTYNVAVGYEAGSAATTGTHLTLLGNATEPVAVGDTNCTVIGSQAVGHGSNTIVMGDANVTSWEPGADDTVSLGDKANYGFKELILVSPDATRWSVTVDNAGALVIA